MQQARTLHSHKYTNLQSHILKIIVMHLLQFNAAAKYNRSQLPLLARLPFLGRVIEVMCSYGLSTAP
jgi:hypothetical protein